MINIAAIYAETFFDWLLRTTYQASLMICLVLLVQWALRRQLGIRARCLLWLVVLVRMALPWAPESQLSIYNLLPHTPTYGHQVLKGPAAEEGPSFLAVTDENDAAKVYDPAGINSTMSTQIIKARESANPILVYMILLWLAGVCFLTFWILAGNMRLLRLVRRIRPVSDPKILKLLDDCRRQMGTRRSVRIIVTDQVYSPALFGFVRPSLLLPGQILANLDRNELRYVFLHELAHLKRHDILLGTVASALHVLHWFNPIIGYGLRRMRADYESACDGLVLSRLHTHETSAYGHTVLRLIEQLLSSRPRLMLAGFLGDRARITQRIAMISRFKKETYRYSPPAVGFVGLLACIGLTNSYTPVQPAQAQRDMFQPAESYTLPEAPAVTSEYKNIKRIHIRHIETGQYLIASGNSVDCNVEPGEAGLWEARFNGEFGPNGDMLVYSVSQGMYLSTDGQGNLALNRLTPDESVRWRRKSDALGVQLISQEFKNGYLRLDEQGQAKAAWFGRDLRSKWDIVQLDRETDERNSINK